mmetsp:Transcript_38911/g.116272  ORF Transcript_38911/g.116272 Transcript_38911/m.116272 type:complete len:215 (-) Transcript_38911:189-833(-)
MEPGGRPRPRAGQGRRLHRLRPRPAGARRPGPCKGRLPGALGLREGGIRRRRAGRRGRRAPAPRGQRPRSGLDRRQLHVPQRRPQDGLRARDRDLSQRAAWHVPDRREHIQPQRRQRQHQAGEAGRDHLCWGGRESAFRVPDQAGVPQFVAGLERREHSDLRWWRGARRWEADGEGQVLHAPLRYRRDTLRQLARGRCANERCEVPGGAKIQRP